MRVTAPGAVPQPRTHADEAISDGGCRGLIRADLHAHRQALCRPFERAEQAVRDRCDRRCDGARPALRRRFGSSTRPRRPRRPHRAMRRAGSDAQLHAANSGVADAFGGRGLGLQLERARAYAAPSAPRPPIAAAAPSIAPRASWPSAGTLAYSKRGARCLPEPQSQISASRSAAAFSG